MKSRFCLPIAVVLLLACFFASPTFGQEESANTQIKTLLAAQTKSWNEGDLEGFMQGYWNSPDLTFSSSGKTTRGWQATLDRYKTSYSSIEQMGKLRFGDLEIKTLSTTGALVLGTWHLTLDSGNVQGNFSLVAQIIDGEWKIIHDHSSTLREPEAENDD